MKKLISLLLTAVLVALPFFPARADNTCGRVQTAVTNPAGIDYSTLQNILVEKTGIDPALIDSIEVTVMQTPVSTNQCAVNWSYTNLDQSDAVACPPPQGCRWVLVVLGVELGILGITVYVIYRVRNPLPPPQEPPWEMYMTTNGMIMEPFKPLIN